VYSFHILHIIYKYGRGPINVTWLTGRGLETPDLTYHTWLSKIRRI